MDDHVARRKRIFGLGMLVVGAVVYLVGLWPGCHTLSEKGYFFAAIVVAVHKKRERDPKKMRHHVVSHLT